MARMEVLEGAVLLRKQQQAAGDWLRQLYGSELAEAEPGIARDILAARRAVTAAQMFARAVLEETRFLKNRWWEQPRVPAGNPEGGQWTESGGGSGGSGGGTRWFRAPAAGPGWARIPVPAPPVLPAAQWRDPLGVPNTGGDFVGPRVGGGGGGGGGGHGAAPRPPALGGGGGAAPRVPEPQPKGPIGRQVIAGREYSAHAQVRMRERGITTNDVEEAIRIGERLPSRNGRQIIHYQPSRDLSVITDEKTGRVVTTHYGKVKGLMKMTAKKDPNIDRLKQVIEDYERGTIDLDKMLMNLEDIIHDNPIDKEWTQSFFDQWAALELIHAVSLDDGRARLTTEDAKEARELIDGMKALIAAKLA